MSCKPSAGCRVTARRTAGSTLFSRVSAMPWRVLRAMNLHAAAVARRPARRVPVTAVVLRVLGPRDDVRRRGADLLVAARASVRLRRSGRGDMPHDPGAVRMLLDTRG